MFEGAVTTYHRKKLEVKNHKTWHQISKLIIIKIHILIIIIIIIINTYNNNNNTYYDCKILKTVSQYTWLD